MLIKKPVREQSTTVSLIFLSWGAKLYFIVQGGFRVPVLEHSQGSGTNCFLCQNLTNQPPVEILLHFVPFGPTNIHNNTHTINRGETRDCQFFH